MRKIVSIFCIICILCCPFCVSGDINVYVNNDKLTFDSPPVIKNDRTLVPVRGIFEALGMTVEWEEATSTVTATGKEKIVLTIGSNVAYVNDNEVILDVAPEIINDRTLVPVRFISESVGCNVGWQEKGENIYITSGDNKFIRDLSVIFLDVGQADCIIVFLPDGKNMIIDAGTSSDGDTAVNYLNSFGVTTIDYVIGTHPHTDHIGGLGKVISAFEIGDIYMPKISDDTQTFMNLLETIKNKGETVNIAQSGIVLFDKNGLKCEIVSPTGATFNDMNNYSAVIKLTHLNKSFLFTGDAEEMAESLIHADISADVLKVGHHGSESSTSLKFLSRVNPTYAVISVGENNSYNHPDDVVINRLADYGVTIYRTDINGTIIATTDGNSLDFSFGEATEEVSSEIVYITRTGSKYHLYGCRYLTDSATPRSLGEVTETHEPCSVCFK